MWNISGEKFKEKIIWSTKKKPNQRNFCEFAKKFAVNRIYADDFDLVKSELNEKKPIEEFNVMKIIKKNNRKKHRKAINGVIYVAQEKITVTVNWGKQSPTSLDLFTLSLVAAAVSSSLLFI